MNATVAVTPIKIDKLRIDFSINDFFRNDYRLDRFLFSRSILIKIDRRIL